MDREAGFLYEKEIPLDSPWSRPEVVTQPSAGDLSFLHKNPEDLAQSDQFCLCVVVTTHSLSLLFRKKSLDEK